MLTSFGDKDTKKIWEGERVKSLSTEIQERLDRLANSAIEPTGEIEGKL
jgi:hypothetical protein